MPASWLKFILLSFVAAAVAVAARPLAAQDKQAKEDKVEKYASGQVHLKYTLVDGKKNGPLVEFYENGKTKIRANYKDDLLTFSYMEYYETGPAHISASYRAGKLQGKYSEKDKKGKIILTANYVDGQLHGERSQLLADKSTWKSVWKNGTPVSLNGVPLHPTPLADIRSGLEKIYGPGGAPPSHAEKTAQARKAASGPLPPGASFADDDADKTPSAESLDAEREVAVKRLNAYRLICGLPHDVTLDADQNTKCQAAAKLLVKVGHLDHTPTNPGLPDDEFRLGYIGTSHSNLAGASRARMTMSEAVDGFMDDSDPSNVERVGHRTWCLNPTMLTTGFGRSGGFAAMWSMDERRVDKFDWQVIAYPPAGYMPSDYLEDGVAWTASINPRHFTLPPESFDVTVRPLDDNLIPGEPLEIENRHLNDKGYGLPNALIFRPRGLDKTSGRRYWVEIGGVTQYKQPVPVHYMVEFVDLEPKAAGKGNGDKPKSGYIGGQQDKSDKAKQPNEKAPQAQVPPGK